jgi:hypothetical protein
MYYNFRRYSDWLRAGRSGDRIPETARFFVHVQTGPGAHPSSCTMGTGSFSGVKRPGRGADHPPLLAPRSGKSRAIPLTLSGPSSLLWGTFNFIITSSWACRYTMMSVGIATGYGLDGSGIESRLERDFSHTPRPARGPPSLLYNGYRIFSGGKAAGAWRWPPTLF